MNEKSVGSQGRLRVLAAGLLLRLGLLVAVVGLLSGRLMFVVPAGADAVRAFGDAEGEPGATVSVLVWNIHKGADPAWAPAFASLAASSDLLLLQEVDDNEVVLPGLDRVQGVRWNLGSMWVRRWNGLGSGPAIGSRLEQLGPAELLSTRQRELGVWTPKASLVAEVDLAGRSLLLVSVHGLNLASLDAYEAHLGTLERRIETHQGPVLLAGDFNCWHELKRQRLQRLVERQGFASVAIEGDARAKPFGIRFRESDEWARWLGVTPLVDLAFVRGLAASGGQAYPVPDPGTGRVRASDHPALRFDLRPLP